MQILSLVLSILGFIAVVTASLMKGNKMKQILFLVLCANFLYATSYLTGGSGINGAASCYLGSILAIINYFFESKDKTVPKWLMGIYAVSFIVLNLVVGGFKPLVYLAIVATLAFVLCINQKSGAKYRFWTMVNLLLWFLYDILSESYETTIAHAVQILFTVAGMIIHDRKKSKEVKE